MTGVQPIGRIVTELGGAVVAADVVLGLPASTWVGLVLGVGAGLFLGGWIAHRLQSHPDPHDDEEPVTREQLMALSQQRKDAEAARDALVRRAKDMEARTAELDALRRAQSEFFTNVSHEFRTPLTLILGPVEALLHNTDALDDADRGRLRTVRRNAHRLLRLVNQLLDVARIEAGHVALEPSAIDAASFVCERVRAFADLAAQRQIDLQCVAPEGSLSARLDADKLEKILVNLLSNAFKATPPGGHIEVCVEQTAVPNGGSSEGRTAIAIHVEDDGVGIAPENQDAIFDRFRRVGADAYDGISTGVGLSLVKRFVELHDGIVEVDSERGRGSCFSVYLPSDADTTDADASSSAAPESVSRVAEAHTVAQAPARSPDAEASPEAPTVLVVDDNADLRAFVRRQLPPAYRVVEAGDGAEALATMRTDRPDCIVADVMMPRMNGVALCRAIKDDEDLGDVPVILLTARVTRAERVEGLGAGADDYVTKPFDGRELRARIANLIAGRRALREAYARTTVLQPLPADATPADEAFVETLRTTAGERLDDDAFGVTEWAKAVGLSPSQLRRRVRQVLDCTPSELLRELRLESAAQLLENRTGTVSEVAFAVGFKSPAHFSRAFKEHFGVAPSRYDPPA
jgi:signal transduction histidine kinase/DNA-binding response OmpR family regulator